MNDAWSIALLSAGVSLGVALAAHIFQRYRERENAARQRAIECMVSVFRTFLALSHNEDIDEQLCRDLRQAVADVQLFGTERQIALASEIVTQWIAGKSVSFDPLLEELRNSLRKQLRLGPVGHVIVWVQARPREKSSTSLPG